MCIEMKGNRMYQTRRDWLIAEMLLGVISIATGLAAVAPGGAFAWLISTAGSSSEIWFIMFALTGTMLFSTSAAELFSRESTKVTLTRKTLCYYAHCRMWWHFFNGLCWFYCFTTLLEIYIERDILVTSMIVQSLPLLCFNIWGVVEHAKALWFDVDRAGTHSLVGATVDRIRNSGGPV